MTVRALIIAIEDYNGALPSLPGTNVAAEEFRRWLMEKKGVDPQAIQACIADSYSWRTAGTTSGEIIAELKKLRNVGADSMEELYFFFSGHGFSSPVSPDRDVDVLVASDFEDDDTGRACLSLEEIKEKLYRSLGPGSHYYFIDACRNPVTEIQFTGTGLKSNPSELGTPTVFRMFSTPQGAVAKTQSGFARALIQGLNGSGIAKDWRGRRMWVLFDRLCDFVKAQVRGQDIDAIKEGIAAGQILEVVPIPEYNCEVIVANASGGDTFTIEIDDLNKNLVRTTFTGPRHTVKLKPFDYYVKVSHHSDVVVQTHPPSSDEPISLFDNTEIRFEKKQPGPGTTFLVDLNRAASPAGELSGIKIIGGPDTDIHLENLSTGEVRLTREALDESVNPGRYALRMKERGVTLDKRNLNLKPGRSLEVDLLKRPKSRVRQNILKAVSQTAGARLVMFSEQLGPITNWDLGLWLSLIGASRIVAAPGQYSKLVNLPLADFVDIQPSESVIYLLAGFERTKGTFGVGAHEGIEVEWQKLAKVKDLSGVYQYKQRTQPGPQLLSIKLPDRPPLTFASYGLPNRATFLVFTEDAGGHINLHQYLLPLHHLVGEFDPSVSAELSHNPLDVVRTMFLAQKQFAKKRPIGADAGGPVQDWISLIYGKWLDPVMAFIGGYELIRRGFLQKEKSFLEIMVQNLRRYFADIPDTEAIAKLIGLNDWRLPAAAPLLLEGVLAFDDAEEGQILPLPPNRLHYGSPWTTWRGAVNDFDPTSTKRIERVG
jgi:hypothetical protein